MNETLARANPLGTERIGKLMVRFAIPSIISLVVNSLYNIVDQVFIGQSIGYLGNAATNVILPLTVLLMSIGLLFGDGAAAFMSLNLGKGKPDVAARGVGNAITLIIGAGVILWALCEIFLLPLCRLFGATEGNLPYALDYGRIIVMGFPFSIISTSFSAFIRADGRPNASMVGLLIGCTTNLILDPIFIFVLGWGVKGAAWATLIGQLFNAAFCVFCMFSFQTIQLKKQYFLPKAKVYTKILSLGASSFITQIASVLVIAVLNNLVVKYGALSKYGADIPLAVFGIVMKVSQLITSIVLGLAAGIQPIYGYNYGAGKYTRVKKTYQTALAAGTLIMVVALIVFQVFPTQIINIFGQESDLYVEFAVKCFRIYLLACFLVPSAGVTGIFFQAIGKAATAALLSLSRQVLFLVPAMLVLGHLKGIEGLLWAGPFSDTLSGVISLIVISACWKKIFHKEEIQL